MARTVTIRSLPEAFAVIKEMQGQDYQWGEDYRAAGRFARRWQGAYPKAVAGLRNDLDELLACFAFKDPSWRKASRTTNPIERRFREVRRRTRPMGVFADRTSIERILFAVFTRENQNQGVSTPFLLTQNL